MILYVKTVKNSNMIFSNMWLNITIVFISIIAMFLQPKKEELPMKKKLVGVLFALVLVAGMVAVGSNPADAAAELPPMLTELPPML